MMLVNSASFEQQVDKALASVKRILDTTRSPRCAAEHEDHSYNDKYEMAVMLTNTSVAALVNVMERMGMDSHHLTEMMELVHQQKKTLTLRFQSTCTCTFLHEKVVEVHADEQVTEVGYQARKSVFSQKVVKKVPEYHWQVGFTYKLIVYAGAEPDDAPICLQTRTTSTTIVTRARTSPIQANVIRPPRDVNITWWMQQVRDGECCFAIDRSAKTCKTPRRNEDIEAATTFWDALAGWSSGSIRDFGDLIERSILGMHDPVVPDSTKPTTSLFDITSDQVFVPVLPLMESSANRNDELVSTIGLVQTPKPSSSTDSPLLSLTDISKFLNEQCRSLDEAADNLAQSYPDESKLVTCAEAKIFLYLGHIVRIHTMWRGGVDYIESMLRHQLIAAIGKVVETADFDQFITHHYRKIFAQQYAPHPFCYAIRRPNHYPDGILSIENISNEMDPIQTMVRVFPDGSNMKIPINAATSIDMTGPIYLHGWLSHRFAASGSRHFKLVARARQFSSFLLIIGNMAGADRFHPKDAIILQNKDEVTIPILLNDLPSAKEFKDAISSLSPEQQRFAISYRSMQLESSVFGVCVVQLKPQLEVLLALPEGALTKEIKLTQDLMSLFVEYQIPSDLLSYDGPDDALLAAKLAAVKLNVKAVIDVIEDARAKELNVAKQQALMQKRMAPAPTTTFSPSPPVAAAIPLGAALPYSASAFGGLFQAQSSARSIGSPDGEHMQFDQFQIAAPGGASRFRCMAKEVSEEHEEELPTYHGKEITSDWALESDTFDFTAMPKKLNQVLEQYDEDNAVRTTTIKAGDHWTRKRQENVLTTLKESSLSEGDRKVEKNKAFDLLDAISRSGSLPLSSAELHVIMGVTHSFDESVMETVIQNNLNPIEKMERSALIVASTIYNVAVPALVTGGEHTVRLVGELPGLLAE